MSPAAQLRRRALLAAPAVLALPARAQTFPARPLRVLIPFAPGGFTDIMGRFLAERLTHALGQTVVIENKPGAGGSIAAEQVTSAPADGYTLLLASDAVFAINQALYAKLPYNPDDLAILGVAATQPNILLAWPGLGVGSVAELIAAAKAKPDSIAYGSFGNGSVSHLTGAMLAARAGIALLHVPYRGSAPAQTDLIAGRIQILFDGAGTALPQVQAGSVRAIGVSWNRRLAELPDVPTIAETLPGFDMASWFAFATRADVPAPVLARLREAIGAALASEAFLRFLKERQAEPVPVASADLPAFLAAARTRWAEAVQRSGARVE